MKTAIYIEDGVVQLVITPESEFEKAALASFNKDGTEFKFMRGQFYGCQGGWIRHRDAPMNNYAVSTWHAEQERKDESLILRMNVKVEVPTT